MEPPDIVTLDRQSLDAWPSFRDESLGAWRLRYGGGVYGRSNSVTPIGDPGRPLAEAVDVCEAFYRGHDLPAMFRIPNVGDWEGVDAELARRGYELSDPSEVHLVEMVEIVPDATVGLRLAPDDRWFAAYFAGSKRGVGREEVARELLQRVPAPRRFAHIESEGRVVAVGLGVICEGTVWLFGMATDEGYRGRGFATRIAKSLLAWAHGEGARRAALQVLAGNSAAIGLYRRLGFAPVYRYHYRRRRT